ncbi:protein kinase [Amycolatopsis sp. Hca4]|uniref:protein kinase domain-containing protein n=1 Tax=Amycolatopsis sp. Hca4 TaxID=2742131 RepID=UPI001591E25D|nr:protein kinase [Amycolatopsis sp. Hca4]QKV78060.1 protein kinase [Amycolatopsis sp. Hca4]
MAQLHVLGDWHGPGEEYTAKRLARELPVDWDVIAGRQIPTHTDPVDLDLIVVGENGVYVCEEKSWGPHVAAGEVAWYVNGEQRSNPVDQVAHAARVLAGRLRAKIAGWTAGQARLPRGIRPVTGHVVMSHRSINLSGQEDLGIDKVVTLDAASAMLTTRDAALPAEVAALRASVMSYLLGLDRRDPADAPAQIMQYRVTGLIGVEGNARVYAGNNPAGELTFLYCVPVVNAPDRAAAELLAIREHDALALLAKEDRTWQVRDWFDWNGYRVTPIMPDMSGTSLWKLAGERRTQVDSAGRVPEKIATPIVHDAFAALKSVHAKEIMHRALRPRYIEVTGENRVRFRDFSRARIPSMETIAPNLLDDHPSTPYRAPDATMEFFGEKDDVYSLALCLVQWIYGDQDETPDHDLVRQQAAAYPGIGELLARCLSVDYDKRPEAVEVATATAPTTATASAIAADASIPVANTLVAGRYRLRRQLGEGAWAVTWLAADEQAGGERTLKYLRRDRVSPEQTKAEFRTADSLRSRYCARVYDVLPVPEPGVLVQEYVPGTTLKEIVASKQMTGDEFRRITMDVLSGLDDAHQQELYHRDVSPSNIIVREDGGARLIDFGLAAPATTARSAVGSPPFIAPEVWERSSWSPAADIYSAIASILTAMLGRYPYASPDLAGRRTLVPPAADQRQRFGEAFLNTLYRGVAYDPADRPQSAAEFVRLIAEPNAVSEGDHRRVNPTVAELRSLYRESGLGNGGNRGLDNKFAHETYAPTWLDTKLLPAILDRKLDVVVLSGNPGDGKTSFLVKVGDALDNLRAETLRADDAGWRKQLDGHTFVAVYDASESNYPLSSDEMLLQALDTGQGEDPERRTVLIAANDGRVTQFFTDHADLHEDVAEQLLRQRRVDTDLSSRVVLVDLKRRALATPESETLSLAEAILDLFTVDSRWVACADCTARNGCPIRRNALDLRTTSTKAAVKELVLTSHLRRRRRATVRDVRSAFAWLITGDLSCEQVHAQREGGTDPITDDRLLAGLAFGGVSGDNLLQEWAELDPAELPAPGAVRTARARVDVLPDLNKIAESDIRRLKRALFLGQWGSETGRTEVRGYRHFAEYLDALSAPERALPRFITGLSRVLGFVGYEGTGLALRDQSYDAPAVRAIVVIKELDATEFELAADGARSPYIESFPDLLVLRHSSGAALRINLDTAEVLLRAADGEILGDLASEAVRQEVTGFGNRLRREPARAVRVIDGSGRSLKAVAKDGRIVREDVS